MKNRFILKDNQLTVYAMACGYIQRASDYKDNRNEYNISCDLWHEGACFHVRAHDHKDRGRLFWESFNNIKEARKFWRAKVKELKLKKHINY